MSLYEESSLKLYVMKPLVSIVIPTYENFDGLLRALESVYSQTYEFYEVIIINDGSTDKRYLEYKFKQGTKLISLTKNSVEEKGYFSDSIRNKGINIASGKYIAFLDDDDYWLKDKLEKQINILESTENSMTCTEAYASHGLFQKNKPGQLYIGELNYKEVSKIYKNSGSKWDFTLNKYYFKFHIPSIWNLKFILIHNCIITSSVVVEKSLIDKIGGFREIPDKKRYSDWDCWIGLLTHTDCVYIKEPLLHYNLSPGLNVNPT